MIAAFAALTIGFFLAVAAALSVNNRHICGNEYGHGKKAKRGTRSRVLKKLKFHGKGVENTVNPIRALHPLCRWKSQPLNKLKFYNNYIIKKAEIAPIR